MFRPFLGHLQCRDLKKLLCDILSDFYDNVKEVGLAVTQEDQGENDTIFVTSATENDAEVVHLPTPRSRGNALDPKL